MSWLDWAIVIWLVVIVALVTRLLRKLLRFISWIPLVGAATRFVTFLIAVVLVLVVTYSALRSVQRQSLPHIVTTTFAESRIMSFIDVD